MHVREDNAFASGVEESKRIASEPVSRIQRHVWRMHQLCMRVGEHLRISQSREVLLVTMDCRRLERP